MLYSLDHYKEILDIVLDCVCPRRVVEVGADVGELTRRLLGWAEAHHAQLVCVDPSPSAALREFCRSTPIKLVEAASPAALAALEPADLYVLDGDHNYATVRAELEAIRAIAWDTGIDTLCLVHDVSWPCARRDLYYAPERLDAKDVHAHSFDLGVSIQTNELVATGALVGRGRFAFSLHAGGERNGVLTAIEDYLSATEGFAYAHIPVLYGLGVLWPERAVYAARIAKELAPFADSPLLALLEANRLHLFERVLELQDELEERGAKFDQALAVAEQRIAELSAELTRMELTTAHAPAPQ